MAREARQWSVLLGGRRVGSLNRREETTWFVFDEEYLADPGRPVLGLRLEETRSLRASQRVPPWFSNLLPEGPMREWIAEARGVRVAREMELLAQVGTDLPGAVQVVEGAADAPSSGKPPQDAVLSRDAAEAPSVWKFSLAGVAMKLSMLAKGDRFSAPASDGEGDWIVKLPDPQFAQVPLNEYAMMRLAARVGIEAPEVRLVARDQVEDVPERVWKGEPTAYAVKRFDRAPGGVRIHIEDLAQVRDFWPEQKYQGTFETVASLLYRGRHPECLREFCRRLVFNFLIGNGDAHLKNWSLIYRNPRVPTISPAYDLVCTEVYREGEEDLGLSFARSRRFASFRLSSFTGLERKLGTKEGLEEVAREVVGRAQESVGSLEADLSDHSLRGAIVGGLRRRIAQLLGARGAP